MAYNFTLLHHTNLFTNPFNFSTIMENKINYFLDAIDNPNAGKTIRILSGCFWSLVLAGVFCTLLFFAYVFQ